MLNVRGEPKNDERSTHQEHADHDEIPAPVLADHFADQWTTEYDCQGVYCEDVPYPVLVNSFAFELERQKWSNDCVGCIRQGSNAQDRDDECIEQSLAFLRGLLGRYFLLPFVRFERILSLKVAIALTFL